jgi:stress-induced morphogen
MSVTIRGDRDSHLEQIADALRAYAASHPKAKVTLYRIYPSSVRIRVVDPSFKNMSWSNRHDLVWSFLEPLPREARSHIDFLLLLGPGETKDSFANHDFDHPVPSEV